MNTADIAWAAGIVDGEGNIHGTKNGTVTLQISMCDAQCLWRFHRIFGGSISKWVVKPNRTAFRRVALSGKNALNAIELMRPWLSQCKLADVERALRAAPNAGKGSNYHKSSRTHCPQGHPYDGVNSYKYVGKHGPQRCCRACRKEVNKRWYERNKHTGFWKKYREKQH